MATVIFLTSTTDATWTVPNDWNDADNSIECIGGGGGSAGGGVQTGGNGGRGGGGGGAGAYSRITNHSLTPGASANIQVGAGGAGAVDGEDTWFGSSATVMAKGGESASLGTGGAGGLAFDSVGTTRQDGGDGGAGGTATDTGGAGGGGGGGAGGPSSSGNNGSAGDNSNGDGGGDGGNGGNANGGLGGAGGTGSAGTARDSSGDVGSGTNPTEGSEWTTEGTGGGGQGTGGLGRDSTGNGAQGGQGAEWGAGSGGGGGEGDGGTGTAGGSIAGRQGIIIITYEPAADTPKSGSDTLPIGLTELSGLLTTVRASDSLPVGIADAAIQTLDWIMSLSDEFAPGVTTAQLTAPLGKTTGDFDAGRIEESANPTSNFNVDAAGYTEVEI